MPTGTFADASLGSWYGGRIFHTEFIPENILYVGIGLSLLTIISILYYVMRVEDRKTFYLAVIMAILLLGSGVTVNSMESTQMSWFPMLFAGMVISSVQAGEGERKC